jgi:CRP/FNR family transcriptional regulator, cyclic AMP receptor protein
MADGGLQLTDGFAWHQTCHGNGMISASPAKAVQRKGATASGKLAVGPSRSAGIILSENETSLTGAPKLLDRLAAKDRDVLLSHGQRRVIDRDRLLFSQGDLHTGIFLIESGLIRVFYTAPSGREITLAYWHPGNFVGGPEVFGGIHMWSAVAARNSAVLLLPGSALRTLITRMPTLALGIIDGLVFKGKCYSALAQILGTRSVTERLGQLLLHLSETYGVPDTDGILIGTVFRHEDLAHMVGATRQWITISLKRLQAAGILRADKGRIVIRKIDQLRDPRRMMKATGG